MTRLPRLCVYAVSDRRRLAPDARTPAAELRALEAWVTALVTAGVDAIQIRERNLSVRLLHRLVSQAVVWTRGTSTRILVNDRVDVARSAGADGVHLPADGLPATETRTMWPVAIVGRSVHTGDGAAHGAACDYAIFGTVFSSRSKPEATPRGLDELRGAVSVLGCPVLAIGGVTPERVGVVMAAGASGIAAIGAFLPTGRDPDALGPGPAVQAFREALAREMLQ